MQESQELADRLFAGDRAALARLISWAENRDPRYPEALARIHPRVGRAWRVGLTGPPGAGKSTLANEMVREWRRRGETVGVLAIDPSSPFTGGALLGDRIRMEERTGDPGVYIRSMASRDSHGGLARAASDACDVMDAFGFDRVLIETVGVGQAEYDVVGAADTVVVVFCPGAGDGIQALKAGLSEVADVLVVNKKDLAGADALALDLEDALGLRRGVEAGGRSGWTPPVVRTTARGAEGAAAEGIAELLDAIERHRRHLEAGDLDRVRAEKRAAQVRRLVGERLREELWGPGGRGARVVSYLEKSMTPYDVAEAILTDVLGSSSKAP